MFDHQKQSVYEFDEFCQVIQVVQSHQWLCPGVLTAQGIVKTMSDEQRHQLFHHQSQQQERERSQKQVVALEQSVQLERSRVAQHISTTEDQQVVSGDADEDMREFT